MRPVSGSEWVDGARGSKGVSRGSLGHQVGLMSLQMIHEACIYVILIFLADGLTDLKNNLLSPGQDLDSKIYTSFTRS